MINSENRNNQANQNAGEYVHNSHLKQDGPNHISQSVHPGAPNIHPDNLGQVGSGQVGHPEFMNHFDQTEQVAHDNIHANYEHVSQQAKYVKTKPSHNHIINPWVFKICIFVLSALGILSMFLPFISVDFFALSESINLFKPGESLGDGVIYVVLLLVVIALTAFNQKLLSFIASVITAVGFSFTLYNFYLNAGDYSAMLNPEVGFYLACISIYGLVVVTLIQTIFSRIEKKANIEMNDRIEHINSNPSGQVNVQENIVNRSYDNSTLNKQVANDMKDEKAAPCCKNPVERPSFDAENVIESSELSTEEKSLDDFANTDSNNETKM